MQCCVSKIFLDYLVSVFCCLVIVSLANLLVKEIFFFSVVSSIGCLGFQLGQWFR